MSYLTGSAHYPYPLISEWDNCVKACINGYKPMADNEITSKWLVYREISESDRPLYAYNRDTGITKLLSDMDMGEPPVIYSRTYVMHCIKTNHKPTTAPK